MTPDPVVVLPTKEPGVQEVPLTPDPNGPYIGGTFATLSEELISPEEVRGFSDLIVRGHVVEVLTPQWTTDDGQRPPNPFAVDTNLITIITPVIVELTTEGVIHARDGVAVEGTRVIVAGLGGELNGDSVWNDLASQRYSVGQEVIVALTSRNPFQADVVRRPQTSVGLGWFVWEKYIVHGNGTATQSHLRARSVDVDELIRRLDGEP